ncbi:MarR family winged helix-turn-helix transcriptional regulator [Demequina sp. NBRC 110054]|uniref:MarR family winged helix-turn-helix transcriptional regulator n=1 Tax=Demequina sp. NBRC 110054 TaxID=1570343 RepID=UPI0013565C79|nr:MarR family winged helix-turn-helix transcriptional regulator [Demequina sp. NBRC 110054]
MGGTDLDDYLRARLEGIDLALMQLRRFVSGSAVDVEVGRFEMSTVLVIDAVSRQGGRATVGAVASELRVAPTTATRFVDRAQGAGLVTRATSLEDGRRVEVLLTDAGRELDAQALDFRVARLARVLVDWDPSRIARLAADLEAFAEAADADDREGPRN